MAEKAKGTKKKFQVPHILVIIGIIVLVACLRTYIAPVGEFDLDEAGNAIAGTYHAVERTTVSPWQALLMVKKGIENAASMISLMLIGGGSIACIVGTGAFDDILNYGVFKLSGLFCRHRLYDSFRHRRSCYMQTPAPGQNLRHGYVLLRLFGGYGRNLYRHDYHAAYGRC